jgi:hypothetical protein
MLNDPPFDIINPPIVHRVTRSAALVSPVSTPRPPEPRTSLYVLGAKRGYPGQPESATGPMGTPPIARLDPFWGAYENSCSMTFSCAIRRAQNGGESAGSEELVNGVRVAGHSSHANRQSGLASTTTCLAVVTPPLTSSTASK